MKVTTEITDVDLDSLVDDGPDDPQAMVHATIGTDDGMRWNAAVLRVGVTQMTAEQLAEALVSALHGVARLHSAELGHALAQWLVVPPELEVD